jgi:Putative Flp pilus-assembly TadE/G-like
MTYRSSTRSERGQTTVLFAFALVFLVGIVSLVADIGLMLREQSQIQSAADAAALAGARALPEDPETAVADAKNYAELNGIRDEEIQSVEVIKTDVADDTVRVEVNRDVGFVLGGIMDVLGAEIGASATAQTGSIIGSSAIAPLAVEKSVFEGLNQGDAATLKYNATSAEEGNFLPLVLDGTGADEYGQNVQVGSEQWLCAAGYETPDCPSITSTQPGNVIGKTRDSLQWVIQNTGTACDSYGEVFVEDPTDPSRLSMAYDCNRFVNETVRSYRVFLVPVIDSLCNGSCNVQVLEFAMFFIESYTCGGQGGQGNSCDLIGRYVRANADINALIGPHDPNGTANFVRLIE